MQAGKSDRSHPQLVVLEVYGHEVDVALHQLGDESDVARQPVELGDHQGGAVQAAQTQRRSNGPRPRTTWVTRSGAWVSGRGSHNC
jgi:hypothetical protein